MGKKVKSKYALTREERSEEDYQESNAPQNIGKPKGT